MKYKIDYIIAAIIAAISLYFISDFIENVPNPNIGTGKIVPTTPPNESNRIFNPDGYSMISPEGWRTDLSDPGESSIMRSSLTIDILKSTWSGKQYACIDIHKWTLEQQSIDSFLTDELTPKVTEIEFNGHPAYWFSNHESNPYPLYIYFEENGYFWEFILRYHGTHNNEVHEIYWDYLKTFRSDPAEDTEQE